jgi:hypothetical protein
MPSAWLTRSGVARGRDWLGIGFLAALALAASAAVTQRFGVLADYPQDAQRSVDALSHGDVGGALAHPALMGPVSVIVRAPFVALARLGGAGQLGGYQAGSLACLLLVGALAVGLTLAMRRSARPRVLLAVIVLLAVVNPASIAAVQWGHPEEALGAALSVAAIAFALHNRCVLAGVALGLAAPKGYRLRLVALAGGLAALLTLPLLIDNAGGLIRTSHQAASSGAYATRSTWWFFLAHPVRLHLSVPAGVQSELTLHRLPQWLGQLTHPLIVALAVALPVLVYRRNPSRSNALPLLAILFLLRCVLDPVDNAYYHLPLFVSLLAWETLMARRSIPVVSLLTAAALWLTFDVIETRAPAGTTSLFYFGWTSILLVYLLRSLRLERRGVHDLEVGAGDPAERVEIVVRPVRVRGAADVPGRAVVGQDHPVALQRLEHDAGLLRKAARVEARLQPDAQAHRGQ